MWIYINLKDVDLLFVLFSIYVLKLVKHGIKKKESTKQTLHLTRKQMSPPTKNVI